MTGSVVERKKRRKIKSDPFKTSTVGHPKKWTESQWKLIDESLPAWHQFALVDNADLDGRAPELQKWKKDESVRLLSLPAFEDLPEVVSAFPSYFCGRLLTMLKFDSKSEAQKCIIRKFTNYRNKYQEKKEAAEGVSQKKLYEAMKKAAASLLDWRAFTKGKAAFAQRMDSTILKRRDDIFEHENEDGLPLIACYQKALKELWRNADQDSWEKKGLDEPDDIWR